MCTARRWTAAHLPRAQSTNAPAKKRVDDPARAKTHHGFEVVGIAQAALDKVEKAFHEARAVRKLPKMDFDREAWLSRTKPRRAISRVFYIPAAAEQAAGMLLAGGGWHRVQVLPILKA